jgi:hypothetical protein
MNKDEIKPSIFAFADEMIDRVLFTKKILSGDDFCEWHDHPIQYYTVNIFQRPNSKEGLCASIYKLIDNNGSVDVNYRDFYKYKTNIPLPDYDNVDDEYNRMLKAYERFLVVPECGLDVETEINLSYICPWCDTQFWVNNIAMNGNLIRNYHCPFCCMELQLPTSETIHRKIAEAQEE